MVKEKIEIRNLEIELEYDKEKYEIQYAKNDKKIVLKRLSDNQIIKIFDDNIGFIVQVDSDNHTNFLVASYSERFDSAKFSHYVITKNSKCLDLKKQFDCDSPWLYDCRITENSYLVERAGYGGSIYNLNEKSKYFNRVFNDKKINDFIEDNTLFVSEVKTALGNSDIRDTITYGINPETFEITTLIWSELQQKYIKVYTAEDIEKLNKQLEKQGKWANTTYGFDIFTIEYEIQRTLDTIEKYFDKPRRMYSDGGYQINKQFIKELIKK